MLDSGEGGRAQPAGKGCCDFALAFVTEVARPLRRGAPPAGIPLACVLFRGMCHRSFAKAPLPRGRSRSSGATDLQSEARRGTSGVVAARPPRAFPGLLDPAYLGSSNRRQPLDGILRFRNWAGQIFPTVTEVERLHP